ncbi:transferrin-binding protein-like solute binding protein [Shinella zoogloeoides]
MYSYRKIALLSCFVAPLALVGCGGGSGGPGAKTLDFQSFSAISTNPKNRTKFEGNGLETTNQGDEDLSTQTSSLVTAYVTVDGNREITSVSLKTANDPQESVWNANNSTADYSTDGKLLIATTNNGKRTVVVGSPDDNGFEFQTYGAWVDTNFSPDAHMGGFSVGKETTQAELDALNLSSTETFTGTAGGIYYDGTNYDVMSADAQLNVNFATAKADFTTSSSKLENGGSNNGLNMSATGMDVVGRSFSGTVGTTGGMSGTVDGRFYGSGAEEVGGAFVLNDGSPGGAVLTGGYGAKR